MYEYSRVGCSERYFGSNVERVTRHFLKNLYNEGPYDLTVQILFSRSGGRGNIIGTGREE